MSELHVVSLLAYLMFALTVPDNILMLIFEYVNISAHSPTSDFKILQFKTSRTSTTWRTS